MNRVEHILTVLSEECHEAGKVACKALRFGLDDIKPGTDKVNANHLKEEVLDIIGTYQMLAMEGVVETLSMCEIGTARAKKSERIEENMLYAIRMRCLQP